MCEGKRNTFYRTIALRARPAARQVVNQGHQITFCENHETLWKVKDTLFKLTSLVLACS